MPANVYLNTVLFNNGSSKITYTEALDGFVNSGGSVVAGSSSGECFGGYPQQVTYTLAVSTGTSLGLLEYRAEPIASCSDSAALAD